MEFHVEDLTCGGCARAVDPPTRTVRVESNRPEPEIRAALVQAGFPPR